MLMSFRGKNGFSSMEKLMVLLLMGAVVLVLGILAKKVLWTSSTSILSLGPTKCNTALELSDYHHDVVMFAARKMTDGSDNPFYEPKLAIQNFIAYLDCRNKDLMFNLNSSKNKAMDDDIIRCGKAALDNYEADLKKQIDDDPKEYESLNKPLIKEIRKYRSRIFKDVSVPPGDCVLEPEL